MWNRRAVLTLFGKSGAAYAAWTTPGLRSASYLGGFFEPHFEAGFSPTEFETRLQQDMTQLGTRVYSEEGIPMILACEDLTAKSPVVPASKAMNVAVSTAFQKYVEAWQHLHPEAPVGDVAKLVELLAYRDFQGGGKDNNL